MLEREVGARAREPEVEDEVILALTQMLHAPLASE